MSSLQPSVPPGLPADPAAQACQSDMGRHRCARFVPDVGVGRQQQQTCATFTSSMHVLNRDKCVLSPAGYEWGNQTGFGGCYFQCHSGAGLRRKARTVWLQKSLTW